jgi:hypothetical protein
MSFHPPDFSRKVLPFFEPEVIVETAMIADACDQVKSLLLEKNAKYGNSALAPARIFSKASTIEQLLVRIDDKLNRIQKGAGLLATDEDVIMDLIGYLVLLKVAFKLQKEES